MREIDADSIGLGNVDALLRVKASTKRLSILVLLYGHFSICTVDHNLQPSAGRLTFLHKDKCTRGEVLLSVCQYHVSSYLAYGSLPTPTTRRRYPYDLTLMFYAPPYPLTLFPPAPNLLTLVGG